MQNDKERDRYRAARQIGLLSTIPILLVVAPLVGFFAGRFLDGKLGTDPALTIVFLVLGFVAAAVEIARIVKLTSKDK